MKLIVTIPAYNEEKTITSVIREIPRQIEGISSVKILILNDGSTDNTAQIASSAGADFVISHKQNKGLAITFKDAIEEALKKGADIIVNTDADNHYDQSKIPELIKPILDKKADMVIGSRKIEELDHMPRKNKYGNILGSWLVCKLAGLGKIDVSSGFRAYTRKAALKMNILSPHTYTHETLIQAAENKLAIVEVPIKAREVKRKSKLIKSIPRHIAKSLTVILRVFSLYNFIKIFITLGIVLFIIGVIPIIRFIYFYFIDGGQGHIQSLIIGTMMTLIGFITIAIALLASAIDWNRKLIEDILYRTKKQGLDKK